MKNKIKKIIAAAVAVSTLVLCCVGAAGCNYCAHQLETIEKQESTCIEHGHGYSYRCTKCNKLFAYTTEKGLYEIKEAETLPLGAHTASDAFEVRVKDGATSVFDYEVVSKCAVCGEDMPMPDENLATIVPPNLKKEAGDLAQAYVGTYAYGEDGTENAGKPYTQITFKAKTNENDMIMLDPAKYSKDKEYIDNHKGQGLIYGANYEWDYAHGWGAYQRFPLYVPFKSGVERQVYYIIKNTTDPANYTDPIKISWCIDGNNWADVTVAPGEVKPLLVKGTKNYDSNLENQFIKVSNPNSTDGTLGNGSAKVMKIEVVGVFYTPGTVSAINFDSLPEKLDYTAGETFDPAGLEIYATYANDDYEYLLGKRVDLSKCIFSCGDRPLTKDDKQITVTYGGARASFSINVTEGGTDNG